MDNKANKRLSKNPQALDLLASCANTGYKDQAIQEKLFTEFGIRWALNTIRKHRRNMGLIKTSSGIIPSDGAAVKTEDPASFISVPPPGLSDGEKGQWFRKQMRGSYLYLLLAKQFSVDEVDTYMEEFGGLCCQFEDIIFSEFFQIDDFLKQRILVNRQLMLIKKVRIEVAEIDQWINENQPEDDELEDTKKQRLAHISLSASKQKIIQNAEDRYDKLVVERQKIHKSLAATRQDRLDQLSGGKDTFFALVAQLQFSAAEREKQGKYAELTRLASEDIRREFSKEIEFPDGEKDPIIMDPKEYGDDDE